MSKVSVSLTTDGCWEWEASRSVNGKGYGKFGINSQEFRAHRISYFMFNRVDPGGLLVLHRCDNPACVRNSHLFLGTSKENTQDMIAKGRRTKRTNFQSQPKGSNHHNSKLTEEDVISIRNEYLTTNISQTALSLRYNVSEHAIHCLVIGKTWGHIPILGKKKSQMYKRLSSQQKAEILHKSNIEKVASLELADMYNVHVTSIYGLLSRNRKSNL